MLETSGGCFHAISAHTRQRSRSIIGFNITNSKKAAQLPEDMYFYSLNPEALISTHRNIDRMFKRPTDIGDESLGLRFATSPAKDKGVLEYSLNGKKINAIFQKSRVLGWRFFLSKEKK